MSQVILSQFLGAVKPLDKASNPEFEVIATTLYTDFIAHQQSGQKLAMSLNRFISVSGSTLDEASKALATAFNHTLSRGYMSKLNNGGRVWNQFPDTRNITDLDKVVKLSRLTDEQIPAVMQELNFANATRTQCAELVDKHLGNETPDGEKAEKSTKNKYVKAIKSLEAIAHDIGADDPTIARLIEQLKASITSKMNAGTMTEVKSA